jgi:hypothetical protein
MSNDTDVFAVLNSESQTELLAAVAYLGNKDRSWRLDVDDVRRNVDSGYSVRLYGWANENSFGNIWITGEEGELCDLARKFPSIEIDGWYRDEHSYGSLYGGVKSFEHSHGEEGGGRSLELEVGSLRYASIGLSEAMEMLCTCIDKVGRFEWLEESGSSTPCDENYPPAISFSIEEDCELEDEEICELLCQSLRTIECPKDMVVKVNEYYGELLCEKKVWEAEYIPFKQVRVEKVDSFIENLHSISEITPAAMLDNLPSLMESDLGLVDDQENTVMHYAAERGLLAQIPNELLTAKNLLRENYDDKTPILIAQENGYAQQLPEECRDENFSRDHDRKEFIEKLISEGKQDLAMKILRNFPNPLLAELLA